METIEAKIEEEKRKGILFIRKQGMVNDEFEERVLLDYFGANLYQEELHKNIRPIIGNYQNFIFVGHFLHCEKDGKLFFYGKNKTDELYTITYNGIGKIRYEFKKLEKECQLYDTVLDTIIYKKEPTLWEGDCLSCFEFNTICYTEIK